MNSMHECFLVDTDDWSDDQRREMCRAVLTALASDVEFYQCDIPFSPDWPVEVLRAAVCLRDADDGEHPHDGRYILTGVFPNDDPVRWNAFVTFAPWTYTAGAWSGVDQERISVSDEAQSMALWLTAAEREVVAAIVGSERLLTEEQNKRRRARRRR